MFKRSSRPQMPPPRMAAKAITPAEQAMAQRMAESKTYTPTGPKVEVPQGKMPDNASFLPQTSPASLKPGAPLPMKKGGKIKSKPKAKASKRADGLAQRGKTKGRFI